FAAALRGILDRRNRHSSVVGIQQHTGQVKPLELVELEVDRTSRGPQHVHDRRKGARAVRQGNQLVASADDRRSDPGRRGRNGNGGRGTTRRTGGDQQRQEEGQPEASRAVHLSILLRICVSVNANRGGDGCGVAV